MKSIFLIAIILITQFGIAQRGAFGNYNIANGTTEIINTYTYLTADANAGSTTIAVNNSGLNSTGTFGTPLDSGDLIFIIQMQGVSIEETAFNKSWGSVQLYNDCGNYEFAEVSSVPNVNTISLRCGLKNDYTSSGHVQIIRVPRHLNLTINGEVTAPAWDGETGGIVVIETLEDLTISNSGQINVNAIGFRGGISGVANSFYGGGQIYNNNIQEGARKGEGTFGNISEYSAINAERCNGAAANAGGGGNAHNCGGGGGANGGDPSNWIDGNGVPSGIYNSAWALESPSISGIVRSGGGKGGYSFSSNNLNPLTNGPNDGSWGGDQRRNFGGWGGRPMDYSTGKIFMAGGGGAGEMNNNNNTGGSGGNGAGIVFVKSFGNISGGGSINANGQDGENTTSTSPGFNSYAGRDAAGGGGAGGTIILNANGTINNLTCNANGGKGGDQILVAHSFYFGSLSETEGPGGGGSGGYIYHTNGTIVANINGGLNGTTNSDPMSPFPPNGATSGGIGTDNNGLTTFALIGENDTICAGNAATVSVSVSGTQPSGTNLIWYDAPINGNFIGFGSNFSTGNLSQDTTFYVGLCPGSYTIPVSVIMGSSFSYSDNNVQVTDENCGQDDGSITGITISGGALPLQYEWNAVLTSDQDLLSVNNGSYTLVVTDNNGCSSTIGTYVIDENTGPTIDSLLFNTSEEHCGLSDGSISGITTSGSNLTYTWNNIASNSIDINNLSAGLYTLEVTDGFGCSSVSGPYEVNNIVGPELDSSGIVITPESCNLVNGAIQGITQSGGSSPYSYFWNNIPSNGTDTVGLSSNVYNLIVEDSFGCLDSIENILVPGIGFPSASFSISNLNIEVGDSVTYINQSNLDDITISEFTISNGTVVSDTIASEIILDEGLYDICYYIENSFGCADSICQSIIVNLPISEIFVPNIITPNGDGINDLFVIQGLQSDINLEIFNRWGQVIYTQQTYQNSWDGRNSSGKLLSEGTYYYLITPSDVNEQLTEPIVGFFMINF